MSVSVELRHISKRFPGVIANKDVSLKVQSGSVHALVGFFSVSGKCFVISFCSGFLLITSKSVSFENKSLVKALSHSSTSLLSSYRDWETACSACT